MEKKFWRDYSSDCIYKNYEKLNKPFNRQTIKMEEYKSIIIVFSIYFKIN